MAEIDLAWKSGFVVARLIRYDACVITGRSVRFSVKRATSSSDIVFPFHWFEFLAKRAMAVAPAAVARSKAVCSPPFVDMCAPRRSP